MSGNWVYKQMKFFQVGLDLELSIVITKAIKCRFYFLKVRFCIAAR